MAAADKDILISTYICLIISAVTMHLNYRNVPEELNPF